MENIGEKIKLFRIKKGLSLKGLGSMVNLTDTALSKIETGKTKSPGIDVAIKIADIFETDVYELFGDNRFFSEKNKLQKKIDNLANEKKELELFKEDSIHWLLIDSFAYSKYMWDAHNDLKEIDIKKSNHYLEGAISIVSGFVEKIKTYYQVSVVTDKDIDVLKSWFDVLKNHPLYYMLEKLDDLPNKKEFSNLVKKFEKNN